MSVLVLYSSTVPVCGCGCRIISANLLICQNPVNSGKSDIPILSITVHIYCGVNVYTHLRGLSNNITITVAYYNIIIEE